MSTATKESYFTDLIQATNHAAFNHVQQGTIMNNNAVTTRGRPKCNEFEDEVIAECERSLSNGNINNSTRKRTNYYAYVHVKNCAAIVMDREYWDEDTGSFVKKWQLNRTTNKLHFTNKWVYGVLRRHSSKTSQGSLSLSSYESDYQDNDDAVATHKASYKYVFKSSFHDHDYDALERSISCSDVVDNSCSNEVDNSWLSASSLDLYLDNDLFGFDFNSE